MSRIIASEFMTLEGVVEGPDVFMAPALSAESDAVIEADVIETNHMVLGARTFAELFAYWPQQPGSVPVAVVTNRARKSIVSSSLRRHGVRTPVSSLTCSTLSVGGARRTST